MKHELFIDGEWVAARTGAHFPTIDPSTEEPIAEVARAGAEDVDRAVRAADAAHEGPLARGHAGRRAAACCSGWPT